MNFKDIVLAYLQAHDVTVSKVEQEGNNSSIVCHIPVEDNEKIEGFKREMEEKLDVVVALSSLFGMNVCIIEGAEEE